MFAAHEIICILFLSSNITTTTRVSIRSEVSMKNRYRTKNKNIDQGTTVFTNVKRARKTANLVKMTVSESFRITHNNKGITILQYINKKSSLLKYQDDHLSFNK